MKIIQYPVRWLLLCGLLVVSAVTTQAQNHLSEAVIKFKEETDSLIRKRDFSQAIDLAKQLKTSELDKASTMAFYLQMQKIYAPPNAGNFDSIIFYIHQTLPLISSDSLKTDQLFILGNLQVHTGKFQEAHQAFQQTLAGIEHLPTTLDTIKLFSRLALTSGINGQKKAQLSWLEKINEVVEKSTDPLAKTIGYYDQLNYYLKKRDAQKMQDLLPHLKAVGLNLEDSVVVSNVARMIATCYSQSNLLELDSAEYYTLRAMDYLSTRTIATEKYILKLDLAATYFHKNKFQKAAGFCEEAITGLIQAGQGQSMETRRGYALWSQSLEGLGQLAKAENYAQKELELARIHEQDVFIESGLQNVIRIQKAQGKTEGIDTLYAEVLILKDSIYAQYNKEQVAEAETRLGLTLREQELENQNLRLAQQQRQQTWYLVVIGLLTLILAGAIWAYRRIQRSKTLISKQKALVEQSLTEKEFLLKEIHHRVKNNLQIISSLLDKQARNSADQILKSKMQEGKDRIQSMALIHQNLYQSENLSSIDIRKYIQELAQNIAFTQQAADQNIKIDIQVAALQLNIDQAIPVGLILNELLTNAFKHAFKNRQEGLIAIQFTQEDTDQFKLDFSDNGKGLKPDFNLKQSKTLGMSLVNGLVRQLEGDLRYESSDTGTHFYIQFSA